MKTSYADITPYQTRDGSEIRELIHPEQHGNRNQSLAEATIASGATTRLHRHLISEELYHIVTGEGLMYLGGESYRVEPGDSVLIPPGTPHAIKNCSDVPLRILCCCAPAYTHADTELLD